MSAERTMVYQNQREFRLGSDDYDQYDQGETHSDVSTSDEDTD